MTTDDPLEGLFTAAPDAPEALATPRRAGIKAIAQATHSSNAQAAAILKAASMRRDANKTYLFDKAVATILAAKDMDKSAGHVAGGDDFALDERTSGALSTLSKAKARYEDLRSQKLEQELAARAGKLVDRDELIAIAKEVGTLARTTLMAVPAKVAANVVGKTTAEAQRILSDAIREALVSLTEDGLFLLPAGKT